MRGLGGTGQNSAWGLNCTTPTDFSCTMGNRTCRKILLATCAHVCRLHTHIHSDTHIVKQTHSLQKKKKILTLRKYNFNRSPFSPPKKKKMLKNIRIIHMKSVCFVCFTVEFTQKHYIVNILSNGGRVVFLDTNQFQILKGQKKKGKKK